MGSLRASEGRQAIGTEELKCHFYVGMSFKVESTSKVNKLIWQIIFPLFRLYAGKSLYGISSTTLGF